MSGALGGFPIEVDERTEAMRLTTNDRDHQREAERPGSNERFRRSADTQPDRERILHGPRVDALTGQRRAVSARPVHMLVLPDLQEEIELLGEESVVVFEAQPEERKCVDERA